MMCLKCVCCGARSSGALEDDEAFRAAHANCAGQKFDCDCEWERCCDGTLLLSRVADPCPPCSIECPDAVRRCSGCEDCKS